jgi:protein-S-isoprenylcysteine O-methyltransferase Ste14
LTVHQSSRHLGLPLPPLLFLGCLAGGVLLNIFWPIEFIVPSFRISLGLFFLFFALAVGLSGSALSQMHRAATPHHPRATPRALVRTGPFRFTRNPLYLALLLVLSAFAVLANSVWLVIAVPVLFILFNTIAIPREEATLAALFGDEYAEYRRTVRRWL